MVIIIIRIRVEANNCNKAGAIDSMAFQTAEASGTCSSAFTRRFIADSALLCF